MGREVWNALSGHIGLLQMFIMGPWLPFYSPVISILGLASLAIGILAGLWQRSAQIVWFILPLAVIHIAAQNLLFWRLGTERFLLIVLGLCAISLLAAIGVAAYRNRKQPVTAAALSIACSLYAASCFFWTSFIVSLS